MKITQLPSFPPSKTLKSLDKATRDDTISIAVDEKVAALLPGSFVPLSPQMKHILRPVPGMVPDSGSLFAQADIKPYAKFAEAQAKKFVTGQIKSHFDGSAPYVDGVMFLISARETYAKWQKVGETGYTEPALATLKNTAELLTFLSKYVPQLKSLEPAAVTVSLVTRVVSDGHKIMKASETSPEALAATSHVMLLGYALQGEANKAKGAAKT